MSCPIFLLIWFSFKAEICSNNSENNSSAPFIVNSSPCLSRVNSYNISLAEPTVAKNELYLGVIASDIILISPLSHSPDHPQVISP